MDKDITLFVVCPCYNEEDVLPITLPRLLAKIDELKNENLISDKSRLLLVDDGSKDKTWNIIESLDKNKVVGVKLAGNRGQQVALLAGMHEAYKRECDCVITIDVDLQDDINKFKDMVLEYSKGIDIVYGVRQDRKTDSTFKRFTAQKYYKTMNKMGAKIIYNSAEYRLMSRRALEGLFEYNEVNLFLHGIVQTEGYPSSFVYYDRAKREAGVSKYPLKKMLKLAYEGITSMTTTPLKAVRKCGIFNLVIGFIALITLIVLKYTIDLKDANLYIILSALMFFTGLILVLLAFQGDYIGKIYTETKKRPLYFIDKTTDNK